MSVYKAKRLAVKFSDPPTLFLEYTECSGSVHVRAVKLKKLPREISLDRLTDKVIRGFPGGIDPDTVNRQQVSDLLQEVIDRCSPHCTVTRPANSNTSSCIALRRSSSSGGNRRGSHNSEYGAKVVACTAGSAQPTSRSVQHVTCGARDSPEATCNCHNSQKQLQQCDKHQHHQQQQQHAADSRSAVGQFACVASRHTCSGSSKQGQQQSADCKQQQQQQQQQQSGQVNAVADITNGMDGWMDGSCSSSIAQQQQQQQGQGQGQGAKLHRSNSTENKCSVCSDSIATCNAVDCSDSNALEEQSTAAAASLGAAKTMVQVAPAVRATAAAAASGVDDGIESEDSDCLTLEPDYLTNGEVDLNQVGDYELGLAKRRMHAQFVQNQVQPGDPAYVYDKQVDFAPKSEANDWDDDD